MQTIHIQIGDQIHIIYVARQMASQITMNPDGTHRRFTTIRQFWARVETECQTLGTVKAEPCVLKKLAREMVKHVSKPVDEAERAEWLARFDADDARAKQPESAAALALAVESTVAAHEAVAKGDVVAGTLHAVAAANYLAAASTGRNLVKTLRTK